MKKYLKRGAVLATLDGDKHSNALVLKTGKETITIITDFGNVMTMPYDQFYEHWKLSDNYIEALNYDIPYPFPEVLERLEEQLKLLTEARDLVERGFL